MLALESVSYRYAGAARPSLRDVSLALPDGEVVGVAGPSEAGKTTLCLVASGLAPRTVGGTLTGRVLLDGQDAAPAAHPSAGRADRDRLRQPGDRAASGVADTVYEEVAFGPMNLGLPRDEVIRAPMRRSRTLHIEPLASRNPARLSGGQQQLVAIAGLLAMRPGSAGARRADRAAGPGRQPPGGRCARPPGRWRRLDPDRGAEDRPAGPDLPPRGRARRRSGRRWKVRRPTCWPIRASISWGWLRRRAFACGGLPSEPSLRTGSGRTAAGARG